MIPLAVVGWLLVVAAFAWLPAWAIGGAALGAAVAAILINAQRSAAARRRSARERAAVPTIGDPEQRRRLRLVK